MFNFVVRLSAFKLVWQVVCASMLVVMLVALLGAGAHAEEDAVGDPESGVEPNSATLIEEAASSNDPDAGASAVFGYAVTPLRANPGESVTVTGQCSDPRVVTTDIRANFKYLNFQEQEFYWSFSKKLTVGSEGKFSEKIVVPVEAYPGEYSVGLICTSGDQAFHPDDTNTVFTVLGEVPTVPPATTPPTVPPATTPPTVPPATTPPTVPPATTPPTVPPATTDSFEELAETGGVSLLVSSWGAVVVCVLGMGLVARARYAENRNSA